MWRASGSAVVADTHTKGLSMSDESKHAQWRWGFWDYDRETKAYIFRPVNESDLGDINQHDQICLSTAEYGDRDTHSESYNVLEASDLGDGEGVTIDGYDSDLALIAAAPDLLAACEAAYLELEPLGCGCDSAAGYTCPRCQIRAAIAKAKGNQ